MDFSLPRQPTIFNASLAFSKPEHTVRQASQMICISYSVTSTYHHTRLQPSSVSKLIGRNFESELFVKSADTKRLKKLSPLREQSLGI